MSLADVAALIADRLYTRLYETAHPFTLSGQGLTLVNEGLPEWWSERGNRLFVTEGAAVPTLRYNFGLPPPTNGVVVIGPRVVGVDSILLWGEAPLVAIAPECHLSGADINCGGWSSVIIGSQLSCMQGPVFNARNGGLISVGPHGLWSSRVIAFTDDMHAILDAETGARINPYGGVVQVRAHVWLGFEVMLLPGADIGEHSVIGARSIVNGKISSHCVAVGAPARVVRQGVTWSADDIPPETHLQRQTPGGRL